LQCERQCGAGVDGGVYCGHGIDAGNGVPGISAKSGKCQDSRIAQMLFGGRACGNDGAHDFITRHARQFGRLAVQAFARHDVGVIEAKGLDGNQDLVFLKRRQWHLCQAKGVRGCAVLAQ